MPIDCGASRERLSEYLDEALSAREMRRTAAHLATCATCRGVLGDLRVTKAVLKRERVPAPRPEFWASVYAAVERESERMPAPRVSLRTRLQEWFGWRVPRAFAAAAVMAVLLLMVLFFHPYAPSVAPDDVDQFVAQHARESAMHPLSDWPRMEFVSSEVNATEADR